ncbi:MAG: Phosphatidylserine/phosphatidylglycerophosphate/cardiolipin synthase [Verrucomicrobia bacterium]|nr:MAG: Phosphatidylserine/phosphatidylglycerophosphate/cardiolipin synthase [Verrucomicrobiota bacterium]
MRIPAATNTIRLLAARLALFLAATLLPACRAPRPSDGFCGIQLRRGTLTALQHPDGSLLLSLQRSGRNVFASARLPDSPREQFAVLETGSTPRNAWHHAKKTKATPIRIFGTDAWLRIKQQLAERIAPDRPRTGIMVTAGGRELLAARDHTGKASFYPIGSFPNGVHVKGHRSADEALADALAAMRTTGDAPPQGTPFVIVTGSASPCLIWVQPSHQRAVFLGDACTPDALSNFTQSSQLALGGTVSFGLRGAVSIIKNPLTWTARAAGNAVSFAHVLVSPITSPRPSGPPPALAPPTPFDPLAWESALDAIGTPAPLPAKLDFLIDGHEFFPAFLAGVQSARSSVDVQVYIFDNDPYAMEIGSLLRQRSADVRVRILTDELASWQAGASNPSVAEAGSDNGPPHMAAWLSRGSKITARPMAMTGLCANHTKLFIIDSRKAWTGGMNIGREYRSEWHDMMISIEGPLVRCMEDSFNLTWAHSSWVGDAAALWQKIRRKALHDIPVPSGAVPVRPLPGGPLHSPLFRAQMHALHHARHRVWIENAYLSDPRILTALVAARYRGADVRVILPEHNDMSVMAASNRALIPQLLNCGVRVFLLPGMSHVKAALYDGWACTGSANFDRLSAGVNDEWNIGFSDPAAVRSLESKLFLPDMKAARELLSPLPANPAARMSDSLLQLLAGQL